MRRFTFPISRSVLALLVALVAVPAAAATQLPEHFCAECAMIRVSGGNALATGPQGPMAVGGNTSNAQVMNLGLNVAGMLSPGRPRGISSGLPGRTTGMSPVGFPTGTLQNQTANWTNGMELPGAFPFTWQWPETRFDPAFIY